MPKYKVEFYKLDLAPLRQTRARPADPFDREQEWGELSEFVSDPAPGLRLGMIYGRRRQGESYPLRRLAAAIGGIYYQALEHETTQALADWDEAVSSLRQRAPRMVGGACHRRSQ